MRRTVSNLIVIASQLLIVGLFFVTVFNSDIKLEKHVSIIHNENLNKIATSVSLLFEEEIPVEQKMEDLTLEELPSIDTIAEEVAELEEKNKDEEEELEADEWEEEDAAELALNTESYENELEESDYLLPKDEYAFQPETAAIADEDEGEKYQAVNSSDLPSMN